MTAFQKQLEAVSAAGLVIERLPLDSVWSLTVTEDDDAESPSTLNIYTEKHSWPALMLSLRLGKPVDTDETFWSFRQGCLLISFMEA